MAIADIALEIHRIIVTRPVEAKSPFRIGPPVMRTLAGLCLKCPLVIVLGIDPVSEIFTNPAAILKSRPLFEIAAVECRESTLGIARFSRDDIYHPVHGIGAPKGRTRPADNLYPLDILRRHVLHFPINSGE